MVLITCTTETYYITENSDINAYFIKKVNALQQMWETMPESYIRPANVFEGFLNLNGKGTRILFYVVHKYFNTYLPFLKSRHFAVLGTCWLINLQ